MACSAELRAGVDIKGCLIPLVRQESISCCSLPKLAGPTHCWHLLSLYRLLASPGRLCHCCRLLLARRRCRQAARRRLLRLLGLCRLHASLHASLPRRCLLPQLLLVPGVVHALEPKVFVLLSLVAGQRLRRHGCSTAGGGGTKGAWLAVEAWREGLRLPTPCVAHTPPGSVTSSVHRSPLPPQPTAAEVCLTASQRVPHHTASPPPHCHRHRPAPG